MGRWGGVDRLDDLFKLIGFKAHHVKDRSEDFALKLAEAFDLERGGRHERVPGWLLLFAVRRLFSRWWSRRNRGSLLGKGHCAHADRRTGRGAVAEDLRSAVC